MKYDFGYSEKQSKIIEENNESNFIATVNGMEYTECAEHSKGVKSNWDDAKYLCVFEFEDIVIRMKH